jgi:hypothetical protein
LRYTNNPTGTKHRSGHLTVVGISMVFDLVACVIAMQFDTRQITGAMRG